MEENVIKKFHPHPILFLPFYVGGFILMLVGLAVDVLFGFFGVLIIVIGEISRRAETFYVTDLGVSREYKFLTTSRQFAEYRKIQNVEVRQNFIENILSIGDVYFDTAGGDHTEVEFRGISYPYSVDKIVRGKIVTST